MHAVPSSWPHLRVVAVGTSLVALAFALHARDRPAAFIPIASAIPAVRCDGLRCTMTRHAVDHVLAHPEELASSARFVPMSRCFGPPRLGVYGIRRGSLLARLGLQNGDVIARVDGRPLDPDGAIALYSRLRFVDHVRVLIERRGAPMMMDLTIGPRRATIPGTRVTLAS